MTDIDNLLRDEGSVYTGKHFVYTSGEHGDSYANCRFLGKKAHQANCKAIAYRLLCKTITNSGINTALPITIVGPETLGAKLAQFAAKEYNHNHDTNIRYAVFMAHKTNVGKKYFTWHKDNPPITEICKDAQLIWMDDLLTTGSTFLRTIHILDTLGGTQCTIATIIDRSSLTAHTLGIKHIESLVQYTMKQYPARECPLCKEKIPIVQNIGHGNTFKQNHPDYPGGFVKI